MPHQNEIIARAFSIFITTLVNAGAVEKGTLAIFPQKLNGI
jgi:hypothetical protein